MKSKQNLFLLIVFMLLLVLVAAPGISYARGAGPSAHGNGKYQFVDPIDPPNEYDETFKLNAREVNGRVKGKIVVEAGKKDSPNYGLLKGDVDCLRIKADGKTAVISGQLSEPFPPWSLQAGDEFWVQVQDNGNGKKADPDLKSEIFVNYLGRQQNDDENLNDCNVDYPLSYADGTEKSHPKQDLFLPGGNYRVTP